MTRIYLSGPMTGYADYNRAAFDRATAALETLPDVVVWSPPRDSTLTAEASWEQHLRHDLTAMLACEVVVVLPGWEASRGASLEVDVAHAIGMPVLPLAVAEPRWRRPVDADFAADDRAGLLLRTPEGYIAPGHLDPEAFRRDVLAFERATYPPDSTLAVEDVELDDVGHAHALVLDREGDEQLFRFVDPEQHPEALAVTWVRTD